MRSLFPHTIFGRLLTALLLAAVVPVTLLWAVDYAGRQKIDEATARERLSQQILYLEQAFESKVRMPLHSHLVALANSPTVDRFLLSSETVMLLIVSDLEKLFHMTAAQVPQLVSIGFVDHRGRERARVVRGKRIKEYRNLTTETAVIGPDSPESGPSQHSDTAFASQVRLFSKLRAHPALTVLVESPLGTGEGKAVFTAGIARNDPNTGQFGGAIVVEYDLSSFLSTAASFKFHDVSHAWVMTADFEVLLEPRRGERRLEPDRTLLRSGEQAARPIGEPTPHVAVNERGAVASSQLVLAEDGSFLSLALSVPADVFRADLERTNRTYSRLLILVIALSLALAVVFSRLLARPIEQLARATNKVAHGELSLSVTLQGGREIEELGNSFNTMVTELSRAYEILEGAHRYTENIVSSMVDALIVVKRDVVVASANRAAYRLLGYRRRQLIGLPLAQFLDFPGDRPGTRKTTVGAYLARVIAVGLLRDVEAILVANDGTRIPVAISGSVMRGTQGEVEAILLLARDTRQLRRLLAEAATARVEREKAEELARAYQALEVANCELESFSYTVSHDLRQPLRHIDGFSQVLVEDCSDQLDEQGKKYLARVRAAAQRMGQLIDDLLTLSRISRQSLQRNEVDLSQMVREIADGLSATQPERRVDWSIAAQITVNADPHLVRIAIENLLGNAWKFTQHRDGARIEFGLADDDTDEVPACFIRDNGAGFDMKYANKLFGAFQRLHSEDEFEGTGIGLATVERIIRRHGGRVWAEGKVGTGATFYFTLPLNTGAMNAEQAHHSRRG
ncbi:MAG: ATP-binding protein [Proteobacteria bacterium]|nr:ATP-binding protein [Pseudomonadota bacterium]